MKIKKAKRLENINEYVFSSLGKIILEVEKETGRKVLNFGPGIPDVKPSQKYIKSLSEFIKEDNAHYYPGYGSIKEFENGLIHWYKKRFNVSLSGDELIPLNGAKDGISHLPLALLNEGDEVLIPDPGYPAFTDPTILISAKPIYYDLTIKNNFKIDLDSIQKKITNKTKLMWINFPSNPTGQVATLKELNKIIEFAKLNNLFIVYDNAYSEITFDGFIAPSILEIKGAKDTAVEIGSFSKSFSFAGFRMGWMAGNKDIIDSIAKIKSQMDSGLSIPLQKLGAYALTNTDYKWHKNMIENYLERRNIVSKYLKTLDLEFTLPNGGLYIWAKIPNNEKNSEEFCTRLLRKKQILFTPGNAFGKNGERYVRISICVNIDKIEEYF